MSVYTASTRDERLHGMIRDQRERMYTVCVLNQCERARTALHVSIGQKGSLHQSKIFSCGLVRKQVIS